MPTKRNLRAILTARGFRRLLVVRLASQLGDGMFSGALAGSILFNPDRQADPVSVAAGFAVLLLPYSLLGPYVGVFLDRWHRRNVLVYGNLARVGLALPAGLLLFGGHSGPVFILLALLIMGINRFILAGHSAAMPHVVDGPRLLTANALAPTLGTVCNSAGLGLSAVAQLVVARGGHAYALLAGCAAIGYLGSALAARGWFRRHDLGPDDTERRVDRVGAELVDVLRGMIAGIRHLAVRPESASLLVAQSAYRVLYGVLTVAALLLYRNYFDSGGDQFAGSIVGLAEVIVAGGLGSFAGALVTPPAARRLGGRGWVTTILACAGLLVAGLGAPFRPELLVVAVFAINIASQGTKIVVDTALQRDCADDFRGRVFSVNDTTYNVCYVLGLFLGAVLLPGDGHSLTAVLAVGSGYVVVGLGYGLLSGRWIRRRPRERMRDEPVR